MRYAPVMALMALLLATTAFAGLNPQVTLPLHGKTSSFETCTGYLPVDCTPQNPPTVNLPAGPAAIFLLINNYDRVAGVQTAFQPDAGWTFAFGLWDCQPGQLSAVTPAPPFGPLAGSITTAFNCLQGPTLGVIGRMMFANAASGCISQIQSGYPFGTHTVDCQQGTDLIAQDARLGKVCIGTGGVDACRPLVAVEPATWGSIKAQYN